MKRSKLLFVIFAAAISAAALCACTDDKPQESAKSGLTGTYTYQETLGVTEADAVRITHDENNASNRTISSTVYPINSGLEGARVSYNMDQRLKLKRDYTYEYEYSVVLGNPGDWGQRFASFTVSIGGTFTYEKISDELYTVELSDPVRGTQSGRSYRVTGGGIYGLAMHDGDDFSIDYEAISNAGMGYDKYVRGRTVTVNKTDNVLTDDIFFPDLLDYLSAYGTY